MCPGSGGGRRTIRDALAAIDVDGADVVVRRTRRARRSHQPVVALERDRAGRADGDRRRQQRPRSPGRAPRRSPGRYSLHARQPPPRAARDRVHRGRLRGPAVRDRRGAGSRRRRPRGPRRLPRCRCRARRPRRRHRRSAGRAAGRAHRRIDHALHVRDVRPAEGRPEHGGADDPGAAADQGRLRAAALRHRPGRPRRQRGAPRDVTALPLGADRQRHPRPPPRAHRHRRAALRRDVVARADRTPD